MSLSEKEFAELLNKRPALKEKYLQKRFKAQGKVSEYVPIVGDEKKLLEDAIQATVIEWCLHPNNLILMPELDMIYAIPNARKANQFTQHIFNITGRRKGFPDLGLAVSRKPFFAYYIELKTWKAFNEKNHGCSDEQLEWHRKLRLYGNKVDVLWSASETIDNLKFYLGYGG